LYYAKFTADRLRWKIFLRKCHDMKKKKKGVGV
jgi:hypothetical protein